jgi:hypothetical protein
MTIAALSATTLGYLSGILGGLIIVALLLSLTVVNWLLSRTGGGSRSALGSIVDSLGAVAVHTDPVPHTLTALNEGLAVLLTELQAVEAHLAAGRGLFEAVADGRM